MPWILRWSEIVARSQRLSDDIGDCIRWYWRFDIEPSHVTVGVGGPQPTARWTVEQPQGILALMAPTLPDATMHVLADTFLGALFKYASMPCDVDMLPREGDEVCYFYGGRLGDGMAVSRNPFVDGFTRQGMHHAVLTEDVFAHTNGLIYFRALQFGDKLSYGDHDNWDDTLWGVEPSGWTGGPRTYKLGRCSGLQILSTNGTKEFDGEGRLTGYSNGNCYAHAALRATCRAIAQATQPYTKPVVRAMTPEELSDMTRSLDNAEPPARRRRLDIGPGFSIRKSNSSIGGRWAVVDHSTSLDIIRHHSTITRQHGFAVRTPEACIIRHHDSSYLCSNSQTLPGPLAGSSASRGAERP
jgi:hypothetical protein